MNVNHGKQAGPDHEPEGRGVLVGAQSGPTVLRIALGAQLRKYREASGLTTAEAAEVIRATHSKISLAGAGAHHREAARRGRPAHPVRRHRDDAGKVYATATSSCLVLRPE